MKKKITSIVLSLGILTFVAFTLVNSSSSNVTPVVASVDTGIAVYADGSSSTPEAAIGVAARVVAKAAQKAWVYGTNAVKANSNALDEAARLGSLYAGTTVSNSDLEAIEEIFDR